MIIKNNVRINGWNGGAPPEKAKSNPSQQSFEKILSKELNQQGEIKFSKHAEQRLKTRNIELDDKQREKLKNAVSKAEEKGIKDSLVLVDNMAFVVSIKNKTVVTAMSGNEMKDNVFTNIDGAVIG